jgi:hypothetical protein
MLEMMSTMSIAAKASLKATTRAWRLTMLPSATIAAAGAAAVRFAKAIADRRGKVSDEDLADVGAAGFTDGNIVAIAGLTAQFLYTNFMSTSASQSSTPSRRARVGASQCSDDQPAACTLLPNAERFQSHKAAVGSPAD